MPKNPKLFLASATKLTKMARLLAGSKLVFATLPFLMIWLIIGTIAQKEMGLYAAERLYFSALITYIGPIPLPGTLTFLIIIGIGLTCRFIFFSHWSLKKAGIHLAHLGVLVLLFGGIASALSNQEGSISLKQGDKSAAFYDFHERRFNIYEKDSLLHSYKMQDLTSQNALKNQNLPFNINIITACRYCTITLRDKNLQLNWQGAAAKMQLTEGAPSLKDEMNIAGMEWEMGGKAYATFDTFPKPPSIRQNGKTYKFMVERQSHSLPFTIELLSFEPVYYPGSTKARDYISRIRLHENGQSWEAAIKMNEPYRHKGYTIYQTSFEQGLKKSDRVSVLTAVKNKGQLFPYIATLLIMTGLLLHILLRLENRNNL